MQVFGLTYSSAHMTAPANRNELMKTDEKENSSPEKLNKMHELYIQLRRKNIVVLSVPSREVYDV